MLYNSFWLMILPTMESANEGSHIFIPGVTFGYLPDNCSENRSLALAVYLQK